MTKAEFKKLKRGDIVISKIVPTTKFIVSEVGDRCVLVYTKEMTNPESWAVVKE